MVDRYDALSVVEGRNGKKFWTKIGVAFPTRSGNGYSVFLDYVPVATNEDGKIAIMLMEPKERDDRPSRDRDEPERRERGGKKQDPLEDDIPFFWAGLVPWIAALAGAGIIA